MFRKQKETQRLLEVSRQNLKKAEDVIEKLNIKNNKKDRLITELIIILKEKGQGSMNNRYNKIEKLVDEYQSCN